MRQQTEGSLLGVGSHRHLLNKNQTTGRHQTTPQSIAGHVQQGQQNPWKESKCLSHVSDEASPSRRTESPKGSATTNPRAQREGNTWRGLPQTCSTREASASLASGERQIETAVGIPSHLVGWSQSRTLLCIDLTAPGLSWCVGSSSLSRDGTRAPCIGSVVLATGPPGKSQGWL